MPSTTIQPPLHDLNGWDFDATQATATAAAARVFDAVKVYGRGESEVRALDGVSVEFATGRFTAIMGPSGSGKSTLKAFAVGVLASAAGSSPVSAWRPVCGC